MICKNFVCFVSHQEKGKILCTYDNVVSDCDVSTDMSCKQFKHLDCYHCGHQNVCFSQRDKGLFYSPEKGEYTPAVSADFAKQARQNDYINAKQDIYNTAIDNYVKGYKITTSVKQLYERYCKKFPEFTKVYIDKAVHLSIMDYLKNQS